MNSNSALSNVSKTQRTDEDRQALQELLQRSVINCVDDAVIRSRNSENPMRDFCLVFMQLLIFYINHKENTLEFQERFKSIIHEEPKRIMRTSIIPKLEEVSDEEYEYQLSTLMTSMSVLITKDCREKMLQSQ